MKSRELSRQAQIDSLIYKKKVRSRHEMYFAKRRVLRKYLSLKRTELYTRR